VVPIFNDYFGPGWQLRAEAHSVNVANTGETNLREGNHEWVGATARGTLNLFPTSNYIPWPDWLLGRISLIGTAQMFYDAETTKDVHYYTAAAKYLLSDPSSNATPASSISFEWDQGINKTTMVYVNQYLLKLNYKY
jgi:hypothetical protein